MHLLLDYPADALRAGGTAAQKRSWLQDASAAVEEQVRSLGQPLATVAAEAIPLASTRTITQQQSAHQL